jgi:hypothetical protein
MAALEILGEDRRRTENVPSLTALKTPENLGGEDRFPYILLLSSPPCPWPVGTPRGNPAKAGVTPTGFWPILASLLTFCPPLSSSKEAT